MPSPGLAALPKLNYKMNDHFTISKITLGTVQLGIPYGIANHTGKPTEGYSHQLLQYALDGGIRSLDTARTYGNAEEVIGTFSNAGQFTIISKFKLSDAALDHIPLAIEEAKESVYTSCKMLQTNCIPILLFHKDKHQPMAKACQILPAVFGALQNEGYIKQGGISVYAPDELMHIQSWEYIHSVQVPMNVFDMRLLQKDMLATMAHHNINVFIRSVYLQGLLAMNADELPPNLSFARPYLHHLNAIAASVHISTKELAFSFVKDTPGVSSIVMGAETIDQLHENIRLLSTPPLSENIYTEVKECFKNVPEKVITPALWKN